MTPQAGARRGGPSFPCWRGEPHAWIAQAWAKRADPRLCLLSGLRKYLDGTRTPAQVHEAVTADVRRAAQLIDTALSSFEALGCLTKPSGSSMPSSAQALPAVHTRTR